MRCQFLVLPSPQILMLSYIPRKKQDTVSDTFRAGGHCLLMARLHVFYNVAVNLIPQQRLLREQQGDPARQDRGT